MRTKTTVTVNGRPCREGPTVVDLKAGDYFRCESGERIYIYCGGNYGVDLDNGHKHHHRDSVPVVRYARATVNVFEE